MDDNQRTIGDNLMEKVDDQKISAGMSSMSFKMKELFQGNQADNLVNEATAETLDGPDWATNVELCDMINHERISSVHMIRAIKNRLGMKNARVRYLTLVLLQTQVNNCVKGFSEVAAGRVLDDMIKMIGDPQTVEYNRNKALIMIEAWGESNELRYLPVYEETYKDDLTSTLVQQCRQSQLTVQRVVETCGDDEVMLFEALSVNDELQKVVSKYEEMNKCTQVRCKTEPAMIAVTAEPDEPPQARKEESLIIKVVVSGGSNHNDEMRDDLDEMVFGKKSSSSSEPKKDKLSKYDLISF